MEASAASYASAPAALLPLLAAPPRFLHLPLRRPSGRRHGFVIWGGGGLLLQPPLLGPGSRARCRTTCCASSPEQAEVLLGGASLVSLAAGGRSPHRSAADMVAVAQCEVLHEHGKIIVNKALGPSKAMYDSNLEAQLTQYSHWLSEPCVSGRISVDEMHPKADLPLYISRPEEVSCSIPTANSSIEKDTSLPVMPHSDKRKAQNSQGHNDKQMDTKDANLVGCPQSDQEEHLDFTSFSSFEIVEEDHLNFVPLASYRNLLEPGKVIEFTNSNAGSSYLPAGCFAPVACLREVPVSKQVKAVKGHDGGWNISNILNKENPDNFAPVKRGGSKGTKDTLDYLRIYNSFLIDGRLKDCMDLLESMEQNGLLDMKKQ
ncbi:uncharacterized protein [Miscanthus floridulus]|uniref:uncharacterized protein n=1 Tax=Miscanthus floridulus TaxID=154761 RepID=UPI0034594421